ncbi:Pogo transposable element with KRAB domainlike [Phytophthora palmivora]|uniref:Pogo transposable element with KRAB domainlike n=1 Tax=Phytophthora palmivora TaxID=4796 RepID=A0A2P4X2D3_9STRA|nr:Pogo transposable element with KRAB domainlike [Phytophthora palmivora]
MPARRKSVELSTKKEAIDWVGRYHMSTLVDAWKRSDQVTYTRAGNPRRQSIETVVSWVTMAWCQVPDSVVRMSVGKCGIYDKLAG